VQDFFFQRIFWFVLGLSAAVENSKPVYGFEDKGFLVTAGAFGLLVFALFL
jgi:hypothetical protein